MIQKITTQDRAIIEWIRKNLRRNKFFTKTARFIDLFGKGGAMWVVLSLVLILFGRFKIGLMIILGDFMYFILVECFLKKRFFRRRPFMDNEKIQLEIKPPTSSSFPSGHSLIAMCSTVILFHLGILPGIISLLFTCVIVLSRLYLMVHYPSDVLSGLTLGLIFGCLLYTSPSPRDA